MNTPLVSVVVPVYNASSVLSTCIDSVLSQSYSNFELLLVNDGSKDDSGKLCDEYATIDSRVKVFHKVNGGVSSARNLGLLKSEGEYIVFCDADDQIDKIYIEEMMQYCQYDVVLCSFKTLPDEILSNFPNKDYLTKEAIGRCLKEFVYTGFSMPWAKLYRTKIIKKHDLLFDENLYSGEDTLWVSEYLAHVSNVKLLPLVGYYYNKNNSNLSLRGISEEVLNDTIKKIIPSYSKLEALFQTNLTEWKLNVVMYFFHRYIVSLSNKKLMNILTKLKESCENVLIRPIFLDNTYVLKGIRLKFFNYMVKARLYFFLAFYIKVFKRYL